MPGPGGTRSCSLVLGPDTAGLQVGRVESIRVLLGRGHSLAAAPVPTRLGKASLAGPPLSPHPAEGISWGPSPASLPAGGPRPQARTSRGAPQEALGRVGERRVQRGQKQHNKAEQTSAPSPQPAPPRLLIWSPGLPVVIACWLARGWVEKCDREIVVPGGRSDGFGSCSRWRACSPPRRNWPAPSRLRPALFWGEGALGARRGACTGRTFPLPSSHS